MFISSFIFIFNFNSDLNYNFVEHSNINQDHEPNDDTELELSQSSLSEYSGVGKAQNVTESGNGYFQNYNLDINNNDKASIIVPQNWKANKIICNISQIYEFNKYWVNCTFDSGFDSNFWTNHTDRPQNVSFGWYDAPTGTNDSIYMRFNETNEVDWNNIDSHLNYTFYLPNQKIPFEPWYIDFNYRVITNNTAWLDGKVEHYFILYVNDRMADFKQDKLDTISNNTWYNDNLIPITPELYNFDPPGTVTLQFGIDFKNSGINPSGFFKMFYDNITLRLSSIPKPSQINLTINDETNEDTKEINDLVGYGKGIINLENIWNGDVGGKSHYFSFSHNSSGNIIVYSDFYSQATSARKATTEFGVEGSEFMVENNTKSQWTMYFIVTQPGSYSNDYYFNISKPINWNVTQVIDPYSNNRINDTIGADYGNSTLTVPNDIIINGLWKIVAEAPNYFEEGIFFRKSNSIWQKNDSFHVLDKLKINGSVKTSLIDNPEYTNITLKVYYPNETLWYQEVKGLVDSDGNYEFSEITLNESSAISGEYSAQIIWHNFNENMTQVGYSFLKFEVIHKTNLTAIDPYFELYKGDPLLLKVNFTDSDFNEAIPFGSITYNSTYGVSGIMIYQGSGIYIVDLDTSSLELGNYYFSFNATKEYFENNCVKDIIRLKIIAQPLELEVPHEILNGMANSYLICQINVTGLFTGALIWPVNISTDWLNPYTVINHNNGTYTLSFSTYNLPTQGISEIYTIVISATKTNYVATSHDMTITVNPIPTIINVNSSLIYTPINEIVEIELFYNQEGSGVLINEAMCSVTWPGSYSVISQAQGFIVFLNTSTLSIDTYTAILKLEKVGYETAYKSITIIVEQKKIEVNTIGFHDSIQGFTGENIKIKFNLTEVGSRIYIENASVFYSWEFGTGFFDYVGNGTYELNLKLPENIKGNHKMTLTISKEGTIYKTQDFSFIIGLSERQVPNILIWILIGGVLILIGVLSVIGLRSKVILPKKRAKESKLLARTQKYKDIMNIEALLVSQRESGLHLFLRSYYALEKYKKELLSGFIHAITTISKEIVRKEKLPQVYSELRQPKSIESLIELDFKHFYFLIGDYKSIRVIFILKEKASDRFKKQLQNLLLALDLKFSEDLANWTGNIAKFEKLMPSTIDEYFELYYKELFQLNKAKYIAKVKEETELSTMENRSLNVIYSISKGKEKFYLLDVVEIVEEKNKDFVIDALESLLEKKIIMSSI